MASLSVRLLCAASLLAPSVAGAQGRAIQLPDTLGANFSIADTAGARATAADFDYLIGIWHFTFQSRRPNGAFNPPFSGHWYAMKKATTQYTDAGREVQSVLVEDQWRPDEPSDASSNGTYTWRAFNSQRSLWTIQGINTWSVEWEPGVAWGAGANRYLVQHYDNGATIMRIRYFAITADSFLWRADMSTDRGRTWLLDRWTMQASRIAR